MVSVRHGEWIPKIGEVYQMYFSGTKNEQGGMRPGLVFQNNVGNMYSPNIIALPMTSALKKKGQPTHVLLKAEETGLRMDSMVLCENPERMSKDRVGDFITALSDDDMRRITEANLLATSAIAYLDIDTIMRVWHKAASLNATK